MLTRSPIDVFKTSPLGFLQLWLTLWIPKGRSSYEWVIKFSDIPTLIKSQCPCKNLIKQASIDLVYWQNEWILIFIKSIVSLYNTNPNSLCLIVASFRRLSRRLETPRSTMTCFLMWGRPANMILPWRKSLLCFASREITSPWQIRVSNSKW
jgi:hypothetical protein